MIVKTVLLGLLSATAAGSVMYFGTLPDDSSGTTTTTTKTVTTITKDGSPNASSAATNTLIVKTPKTTEEATVKRLPSLRDTIKDKRMERGPAAVKTAELMDEAVSPNESGKAQTEKPKKRWLDQYLKNQNKDAPVDDQDVEVETEIESVEIELFEKPIPPAQPVIKTPKVTTLKPNKSADMLNDILGADSETPKSTRYFKIEGGVLVEVKQAEVEPTSEDAAPDGDIAQYNRGVASKDRIFAVAFEEAARITKPELRDQAYFGVLEYALRQDNFVEAEQALDKIEQVDMNYTGKSRIAVAFAQKGLSSMAFKTINSVDEPELRDFMRLQVIEAMIAPQRLPSQWREGNSN